MSVPLSHLLSPSPRVHNSMNFSWDDGSTSMTSVDLLSTNSGSGVEQGQGDIHPSQSNLEQISEETNNAHTADMMLFEEAAPMRSPPQTPSLLSSSSEQPTPQHQPAPADPPSGATTIYQIDFDVEHLGKNKPQSKRMAIWKYGLEGRGGAAGPTNISGHEAQLTWSTHSGKYTISVDGEDVFSNVAKGSVLEHKWNYSHSRGCVCDGGGDDDDDDGVAMRIIACRKPPVRSSKNFRCYEFIIGGTVFRDLPVESGSCGQYGVEFQNEEDVYANNDGKLMSILDVIEPGWRSAGFA